MRQFTFDLSEGLTLGLRPEERIRNGVGYLHVAKNVKAKSWGLDPYEPAKDPFTGHTVNFPWPQLVYGEQDAFLFYLDSIERVNVATWGRTSLTTFDQTNGALSKAISSGGQWHFADMGRAWFAFNGSCVVFNTGLERLHGLPEKIFVQDTVEIQTGCVHKGRVFFGGFNPANIWANWSTLLTGWDTAETDLATPRDEIGKNYVMWSSVGGGDMPLWLFWPLQAGYTYDLNKDATLVRERVLRNEMGWKPMPFRGRVLRVAPLGDQVIVYGEDGIVAMKPEGGIIATDVPPTYREIPLAQVGILNRNAVGIAAKQESSGPVPQRHIFVDTAGHLWQISGDLGVTRLGYKEFLAPINNGLMRISYNQQLDEFLICGSTKQYVLTDRGLTEHTQRVTSGVFVGGEFKGVAPAITDNELMIVGPVANAGAPGIKTFTELMVEGKVSALQAAFDYRFDQAGVSFTRSAFRPLNKEGWVRLQQSGVEVRPVVKSTAYAGQHIDRLVVAYQHHDKRFRRATEVDPSFTRPSE